MHKRVIGAIGMCFAAFMVLSAAAQVPALAQTTTATASPTVTGMTCQNIVSHALQLLQNTCAVLDRNNACYGNDSIQAQLTSADFSFQHPGDTVPIKIIKTVSTSPLNQSAGTWGLSLFKLQANLPDTLPGQNVLFLVFGDTSIQNISGDMSAFYFSTGLGAPACDAVPNTSILVRSPDHEQVTFTANGVKISIASTVRLTAVPNQAMTVQLIEGHATVATPKGSRVLQPSESVSITMGGATGLEPQGVPSPATDAAPDTHTLGMVSSLNTLTASNVAIPIKGCVTAVDTDSVTIGNVPVQMTADDLAARGLNVGDCLTLSADVRTDNSGSLMIMADAQSTTVSTTTNDSSNGISGNGTSGNGNNGGNSNCDNGKGSGGKPPDGPGNNSGCPKVKPPKPVKPDPGKGGKPPKGLGGKH